MTTLARITIGILMAIFFSSCAFDINFGNGKRGNGVIANDTRDITDSFTVVTASEGLDVYVSQADEFSIKVEADENVIDLIGTDIKDGKLKIHAIESIGRATKKIYVSLPTITGLDASSGADLLVENTIKVNELKVNASSGADIKLKAIAEEVSADASSGADIRISGTTNLFYANASSGSDIKAKDFLSKTCHADASSGSDISIHVSESLNAQASSGADISYAGEPTVNKNSSVSGSISKR